MDVAKTVLEVADVAWTTVERCHRNVTEPLYPESEGNEYSDVECLLSENQHMRLLLETNLTLLQHLHGRLLAAVNSESFLNELENLREKSKDVSWWVWVSEETVSTNAEEERD